MTEQKEAKQTKLIFKKPKQGIVNQSEALGTKFVIKKLNYGYEPE